MISLRAARPSFSGIVMSSVVSSGLSSWKRATASGAVAGLADHLVAALGQRVADHLPHERGIVDYQDSGHRATSIPDSVSDFVVVEHVLDAHGPVGSIHDDQAAGGEAACR